MNEALSPTILMVVALILLATLLLGMIRIWLGPAAEDRMLTSQLFGTTGIALLLVLSEIDDSAPLRNVALILAVLAVMSAVAFVSRGGMAVPDSLQQTDEPSLPLDLDPGQADTQSDVGKSL